MTRLEERIRTGLNETAERIDDLIIEGTPVVPPVRTPRPTVRRGLIIAAAAAVVIFAFAIPLLIQRSEAPPATQPSPSTLPVDQKPLSDLFDLSDWIVALDHTLDNTVVLIHPDGSGRREIAFPGSALRGLYTPDWSPDGSAFVVERGERGAWEVVEYELATGAMTRPWPCANTCLEYEPAYSPDGSSVAFVYDGLYLCGIRIQDTASVHHRMVTDNCQTSGPRWSPDGTKLVYEEWDGTGLNQVVKVMDLASGEATQITDPDLNGGKPDWSPDGDWIVFCDKVAGGGWGGYTPTGPGGNLYRARPDGSELEQLTFFNLGRGACEPRYTPDGAWIVFTLDYQIWVMPSEGGEAFPLLTDGTYGQPDWQP